MELLKKKSNYISFQESSQEPSERSEKRLQKCDKSPEREIKPINKDGP